MFDFSGNGNKSAPAHSHPKSNVQNLPRQDPAPFDRGDTTFLPLPPRALTSINTSLNPHYSPSKPRSHPRTQTDLPPPTAPSHQRTRTESTIPTINPPPPLHERRQSIGLGIQKSTVITTCFSAADDIDCQLSPESSPNPSPSKERWSFLSKEKPSKPKLELMGLESWFKGESDALNIGLVPSPSREGPDTSGLEKWFKGESDVVSMGIVPSPTRESFSPTTNTMSNLTGAPKPTPPKQQSTPTPRPKPLIPRFSFFTSKPVASPTPANPLPPLLIDEFYTLNPATALEPHRSADPFSPSSFKNLLQHADGLLARLQSAYQARTILLQETLAETDARGDELEEAQTRAQHLKLQLDTYASTTMSEQATTAQTQESEMEALRRDLATERRLRREAEARTIRLVSGASDPTLVDDASSSLLRRGKTGARASLTPSDSGFESEAESVVDSTFSRAASHHRHRRHGSSHGGLRSPDSALSVESPESGFRGGEAFAVPVRVVRVRGVGGGGSGGLMGEGGGGGGEGGDMLEMLRVENEGLKERVRDLERDLEGVLELVGGMS